MKVVGGRGLVEVCEGCERNENYFFLYKGLHILILFSNFAAHIV